VSITVRRATTKDAALIATLIADAQELHVAALPRYSKSGDQAASAEEGDAGEVHQAAEVRVCVRPVDKVGSAGDAAEVLAKPERLVFIACVGVEPAGFVHAEMIYQPETSLICEQHTLYIHAISVRPDYRRRGVGSALMAAVRGAGQSLRIEGLVLDVWIFNEAARQFFRRQGLTACCERYVTASDLGRN